MPKFSPKPKIFAIFWDYENVPLRHKDGEEFLLSLKNFIQSNNVVFARLYSKREKISDDDYTRIKEMNILDFKWVRSKKKNATDYIIYKSCLTVLHENKNINTIMLISGDNHFVEMIYDLYDWDVNTIVVCQRENVGRGLITEAQRVYFIDQIILHPEKWWASSK